MAAHTAVGQVLEHQHLQTPFLAVADQRHDVAVPYLRKPPDLHFSVKWQKIHRANYYEDGHGAQGDRQFRNRCVDDQ